MALLSSLVKLAQMALSLVQQTITILWELGDLVI